MGHGEQRAILIAGPTASGKSMLALRLAERLGGTVINADSMQVYRDLRVLTARPGKADEARAPHRLYGHIDGADSYSVSRWLADVGRELALVRSKGGVPIVVGGTGLYFKALTQGLSAIPQVPPTIRAEIRDLAARYSPPELHARLALYDPAMAARLEPNDAQRVARALEVWIATGQSLLAFQASREPAILPAGKYVAIALERDRHASRKAVDGRFLAMLDDGALEEVRKLRDRQLPPTLPIMRSLGVPPLLAHLRGGCTLAEAAVMAQGDSRAYLKRQCTFVRHQLQDFLRVDPEEAEAAIVA